MIPELSWHEGKADSHEGWPDKKPWGSRKVVGKATYDKSRLSVVGKASVMLCPAVEAVGAGV